MSLIDFPDEIILDIVLNIAASAFPTTNVPAIGSYQSILNEHSGLEPLSLVNSRLRRICAPTLFSHLVLHFHRDERPKLDKLLRILRQRPFICEWICSVRYVDAILQLRPYY
jgi:hypothetical protein